MSDNTSIEEEKAERLQDEQMSSSEMPASEMPEDQLQDTQVSDSQVSEESEPGAQVPEKEDVRVTNLRMVALAKEKVDQENKVQANKIRQLEAEVKKLKYEDDDYDSSDTRSSEATDKLAEKIANLEQQIHLGQVEKAIVAKYPDFQKVADTVNMSVLQARFPDEYNRIMSEDDIVKRADMAYASVKKFKIYEDPASNKREKIISNMQKPKVAGASTASGVNTSPLNMLRTSEGQSELRRKAMEAEDRIG